MVSMEFFNGVALPVAIWSWSRLSFNRYVYQVHFLGVKAAGA